MMFLLWVGRRPPQTAGREILPATSGYCVLLRVASTSRLRFALLMAAIIAAGSLKGRLARQKRQKGSLKRFQAALGMGKRA